MFVVRVCCLLFVDVSWVFGSYPLFVVDCLSSVVSSLLVVVCRLLFVVCLLVVCCLLFVFCLVFAVS